MNILDENVPEGQRQLLLNRGIRVRQIGEDVGRKGMKDDEVLKLLHGLDRPTLVTRDGDFYGRRLCHEGYCLIYVDAEEDVLAEYVYRMLRLGEFKTKAKRMGHVIRLSPASISCWQVHQERERSLIW